MHTWSPSGDGREFSTVHLKNLISPVVYGQPQSYTNNTASLRVIMQASKLTSRATFLPKNSPSRELVHHVRQITFYHGAYPPTCRSAYVDARTKTASWALINALPPYGATVPDETTLVSGSFMKALLGLAATKQDEKHKTQLSAQCSHVAQAATNGHCRDGLGGDGGAR